MLCGRFAVVLDADTAARLLQLVIDRERRPRSIESVAPYNSSEYLGPRRRPAHRELRLPGA